MGSTRVQHPSMFTIFRCTPTSFISWISLRNSFFCSSLASSLWIPNRKRNIPCHCSAKDIDISCRFVIYYTLPADEAKRFSTQSKNWYYLKYTIPNWFEMPCDENCSWSETFFDVIQKLILLEITQFQTDFRCHWTNIVDFTRGQSCTSFSLKKSQKTASKFSAKCHVWRQFLCPELFTSYSRFSQRRDLLLRINSQVKLGKICELNFLFSLTFSYYSNSPIVFLSINFISEAPACRQPHT